MPAKVFTNASRGTNVAIDWARWPTNEQGESPLLTLLAKYSQAFPELAPGLVWQRKETIDIAGREWLYLEFTVPLREALVYNSYYAAVSGGQVVLRDANVAEPECSLFAVGAVRLRESLRLK